MPAYTQQYPGDLGVFDLLAPSSSGGYYHIFAARKDSFPSRVRRRPLKMRSFVFTPGEDYSKFGSNKKTSAGFIRYDGPPITFEGIYLDVRGTVHALFSAGGVPFKWEEYSCCYWSWKVIKGSNIFIGLTSSYAARVMEFE